MNESFKNKLIVQTEAEAVFKRLEAAQKQVRSADEALAYAKTELEKAQKFLNDINDQITAEQDERGRSSWEEAKKSHTQLIEELNSLMARATEARQRWALIEEVARETMKNHLN